MSHDADVLNRLVAHLRGAADAYRRAGADGPGLADAFGGGADAHARTAEELAAVVRALGERPEDGGGGGGAGWEELPRALAEGERATANAVEHGEAGLMADFQAAMDDGAVSGPVRDAIVRGFDGVKAGHDRALQRLAGLGG